MVCAAAMGGEDALLWAQLALVALVSILALPGARGSEAVEEYVEAPVEREPQEVLVR